MALIRIVIIGPESTGKSTLCASLAEHFNTLWVREYAREYLIKNGVNYTVEDLFTIAQGQLKNEDTAASELEAFTGEDKLLFADTDLYVIKVWSEFVFNSCDNRVLNAIATRKYDLYLLCNTDLPWVKDELREYPDLEVRDRLYHYYKADLAGQDVPWKIISGTGEERLEQAIEAVREMRKDSAF